MKRLIYIEVILIAAFFLGLHFIEQRTPALVRYGKNIRKVLDENDLTYVSVDNNINKVITHTLAETYGNKKNNVVEVRTNKAGDITYIKAIDPEFSKYVTAKVVNAELSMYGESRTAEAIRDKDVILEQLKNADKNTSRLILFIIGINILIIVEECITSSISSNRRYTHRGF